MPSRLGFALFLAILLLITSCGKKTIPPMSKRPADLQPAKTIPAYAKIPPTQKPYTVFGKRYYPIPSSFGFNQTGTASWYGKDFHGKKTSNGETYDMHGPTAAHKTLPMGTRLLVKNLENNKETVVRVNDRGPFVKNRIIDLSYTAAKAIDMVGKGTARVSITALGEAVTRESQGRKVERFLPYQDFRHGEYYVQIGSFTNKANAERLKNKMLAQGKKTVDQVYNRGDQIFYRVQVRAGSTIEAAEIMENHLEAQFPGAFIIAH